MLSSKYIRLSNHLVAQTPEPPQHERGQSVLQQSAKSDVNSGTRKIRLKLGYALDSAGHLRIVRTNTPPTDIAADSEPKY